METEKGRTIEKTLQYATIVDTLPEAWTFVMAHVELVGENPRIEISPSWYQEKRAFEVMVRGMVEQ